jgi:uncharacterized C2H2 Zn-finger protein
VRADSPPETSPAAANRLRKDSERHPHLTEDRAYSTVVRSADGHSFVELRCPHCGGNAPQGVDTGGLLFSGVISFSLHINNSYGYNKAKNRTTPITHGRLISMCEHKRLSDHEVSAILRGDTTVYQIPKVPVRPRCSRLAAAPTGDADSEDADRVSSEDDNRPAPRTHMNVSSPKHTTAHQTFTRRHRTFNSMNRRALLMSNVAPSSAGSPQSLGARQSGVPGTEDSSDDMDWKVHAARPDLMENRDCSTENGQGAGSSTREG